MKRVVVVVADAARAAEALRAAVGLTLRDARVDVVRLAPLDERDPAVARALAALRGLGGETSAPLDVLHEADAVEVWSDGATAVPAGVPHLPRRLLDDVPPDKLLDLVLAQRPVVIW